MARIGLMSGGIDSPVAAARAMLIGWDLYSLHFSMETATGPEAQERSEARVGNLEALAVQAWASRTTVSL